MYRIIVAVGIALEFSQAVNLNLQSGDQAAGESVSGALSAGAVKSDKGLVQLPCGCIVEQGD